MAWGQCWSSWLSFSSTGGALMKDLTWPAFWTFTAVLAALVIMFGLSDDVTVRNHLLGYFDSIVPFIVGTAAGGAVGSAVAFRRGFAEGKASQ